MFCHKALTTRLVGKIKRFLVQFKKVSSVAPVLGEEVEKFLRLEVAAERSEVKDRAERTEEQAVCDDMTHCQEHEHEEPEEQKEGEVAKNEPTRRIFSAHQREKLLRWQEKKRGQSGGNASKEGSKKRGILQKKGLGRVQHTVAAYIGKGGFTLSGNNDARGMAAV